MSTRKARVFPVIILSIPLTFISGFLVFFVVLFTLSIVMDEKAGSVIGLFSIALTIPISIILGGFMSVKFLGGGRDDD
jgi:hypothetical protein